jgi:hypothetical protein
LRIGARNYSTHPTGQRACRRPANFIVAGQLMTPMLTVFSQGLSRSSAAAIDSPTLVLSRNEWGTG